MIYDLYENIANVIRYYDLLVTTISRRTRFFVPFPFELSAVH